MPYMTICREYGAARFCRTVFRDSNKSKRLEFLDTKPTKVTDEELEALRPDIGVALSLAHYDETTQGCKEDLKATAAFLRSRPKATHGNAQVANRK